MAGAGAPDLPPWAVVDVKWSGGRRAWTRAIEAATAQLHGDWRALRDALVSRGLLTPPQCAGLEPSVKWSVLDKRRVQARPLPPLPEIVFDPVLPR